VGQAAVGAVLIFETIPGHRDIMFHALIFTYQLGSDCRASGAVAAGYGHQTQTLWRAIIMLTLLGSLLGFFSSTFPDLLKLWQDRADRQHELDILDRQMEQMRFGAQPAA
jgi:hypothetical protein